jgi:hypothetical protein
MNFVQGAADCSDPFVFSCSKVSAGVSDEIADAQQLAALELVYESQYRPLPQRLVRRAEIQ